MAFTKEQLRTEFIHKRNQLSQVEYAELCQNLLYQFQQLDLQDIRYVHMFLPIHKRKEPDTFLMRDWLKANHLETHIVYPKTNFADHTMQSFLDDADLQLDVNAFGIPEPLTGNVVNPQEVDLMLVPLLAFDKQGYRVGYGKGFYDRFIAQCRPDAQFIGLSFWEPVEQIDDINQYDRKMTACLTPEKIFRF